MALANVEREFGVSEIGAATGDRTLRIWNQRDSEDGVTWGVHPVSVDTGQAWHLTVSPRGP